MITYSQAEFLLEHYHSIVARAMSAGCELRKLAALNSDTPGTIEGLALRTRDISGQTLVQTNATADMTATIALHYRKINKRLFTEAMRQIAEEAVVFTALAEKVRSSLRGIRPMEEKIIRLYYFNGLTHAQIARKVRYAPDHCRRIRRQAVEKLQGLITLDDLEKQHLQRLAMEGTS